MKKFLGSALMALAISFGIIATTSTTANAQWRNRNYGYNNQQVQQGYQYGLSIGAEDAQRRQSYSPQRSRYYRNASTQDFREGFVRGYEQGYRQQSANNGNGGYRNDGYYGNGRNDGYYGNRRNDGYYGNGGYNNEQINQGYNQGLSTGAIDGQRGQSYNPQRSKYYQRASTQAYREGFVRGYDEGFRQYRNNGSYRNSGTSILDRIFNRP